MNVMLMFISGIIMAVIGFITTKLWGIDIPKFVSDTVVLLVLTVPLLFYNPYDIEAATNFIENYIVTFINILPGVIIGDIAGTLFYEFVKPLE